MIKAGQLDERVTISSRTATKDPQFGTTTYEWSDLATVYADVYEVMGGEDWAQGLDTAKRPISVQIRYRDDLDSTMRLTWRGQPYRIVRGPAELGRREGIRIVAERQSTEGEEA